MSGTTSGVQFRPNGHDTDLIVYRGKSLSFEVVWGGASPIDITGHTAALRARAYNGKPLLELSTANGGIANGGPTGKLSLTASPATTRSIDSPGFYELELIAPNGSVYRVISGKLSFEEEVAI